MKQGFILTGADTDSIAICKKDQSFITEKERQEILKEINALFPEKIKFEDDGYYEGVLVVKAKNYALRSGDKIKIKGSALKATMKETRLVYFLDNAISFLLDKNIEAVKQMYMDLVMEIGDITDITPWCSKKTVTNAVLNSSRANETRVLAALNSENIQEGDKVRMFFETPETLCLDKNFKGVYDKDKLYEKLFKTVKVLAPVLDMNDFLNYKLKKNKKLLEA